MANAPRFWFLAAVFSLQIAWSSCALAAVAETRGQVALESIPNARFAFEGILGQRIKADVDRWLLVTPEKNPGLVGMFARREANVERDSGNSTLR